MNSRVVLLTVTASVLTLLESVALGQIVEDPGQTKPVTCFYRARLYDKLEYTSGREGGVRTFELQNAVSVISKPFRASSFQCQRSLNAFVAKANARFNRKFHNGGDWSVNEFPANEGGVAAAWERHNYFTQNGKQYVVIEFLPP